VLRGQAALELGVGAHQRGVGPQGVAERQLLAPARAAGEQQVQVRRAVPVHDLDEEAAPRPGVELGRDEVPARGCQRLRDLAGPLQVEHRRLHVEDGLGRQAGHGGRAHVLDRGDPPGRERGVQLGAQLGSTTRPRRLPRLHLHLLGRPGRPVAHAAASHRRWTVRP
jgi:hypothetical protein